MQSKWLTWQPGSVGFVGPIVGGNSIIQSEKDTDGDASSPYMPSIIENIPRNLPTKPTEPLPPDSSYSELACQAMQKITKVCPPGALKWARAAHPTLTNKIDVELVPQLSDLWNNHAPLADFEAALAGLVSVHEEAGRLFREQVASDE